MLQFRTWQVVLIWGLIALAAVFAAPNLLTAARREALPNLLPKSHVNLGLDLQGGSYLLLGVDTKKVISDRLNNTRQEIQRALRPSGGRPRIAIAEQPTINQDEGLITVRLREPSDLAAAEKRIRDAVIGATFVNATPFYEITAEEQRIRVRMTEDAERRYKQEALAQSIEIVRRRIDPSGTKEVSIAPQGAERIVIQAPGDNDPEALKALVVRTGQLSFHRVDQTADPVEAQNGRVPPSRIFVPFAPDSGEGPGGLVLHDDPEITGDMVRSASAGLNDEGGGFQINFAFDNAGAIRFGEFTREHVGDLFAIVLDNTIISAPRIQTPITGGSGRITGGFGSDEASRVATLIRSGALPAPLSTKDQRSVGPELGADSVRAGAISLVISFILVILFMLVTYGRFGVYANIALVANVILMAGFLSLINATLTLPGVAGVVLTIGMAVDANVLIYERIREELAAGKAPIKATELGFEKALSAIADSQITTFLAAVIMLVLGAGPVRGFAVTLAVGVATSVFTAIYVTKLLVGSYLLKKRPAALIL